MDGKHLIGGKSARTPPGTLLIVATPIGNLGDMTFRAVQTLKDVSRIFCEDTRTTQVLTRAYGIETSLTAYHEHNADNVRPKILNLLKTGQSVALVSDAGTPLISDPGYKLVVSCHQEGIPVTALPGACAAVVGLCVSGLPSDRFFFQGFLPPKSKARCHLLESLTMLPGTLIFYESPHRIQDSLMDMVAVFGPRPAALSRELTKKFEETRRGTLQELLRTVEEIPPRGEITVLVAGASTPPPMGEEDLEDLLRQTLKRLPFKEAVQAVAFETGSPRRLVYQKALTLKESFPYRKDP